jgi:hypothetical protein
MAAAAEPAPIEESLSERCRAAACWPQAGNFYRPWPGATIWCPRPTFLTSSLTALKPISNKSVLAEPVDYADMATAAPQKNDGTKSQAKTRPPPE